MVPADSYLIIHGRRALGPSGATLAPPEASSGSSGGNSSSSGGGGGGGRSGPRRALLAASPNGGNSSRSGGSSGGNRSGGNSSGGAAAAPDIPDVRLSLGFARDLLGVAFNSVKNSGTVELQSLRLAQLAQGPEAAAAAGLEDPDVWTLMLWGFRR
jgi:hypothetical protein